MVQLTRSFMIAVDSHTARHIYGECLKGDLLLKRTVIMVSHHVHLCGPGAKYVVSLNGGKVEYAGDWQSFQATINPPHELSEHSREHLDMGTPPTHSTVDQKAAATPSQGMVSDSPKESAVNPREAFGEAEKRTTGRIHRDVWITYFRACGNMFFWIFFILALVLGAMGPVLENGWLK